MVEPCSTCGSTKRKHTDGKLYCATCGSQIETYTEYEQEDEHIVMFHAAVRTKKQKVVPTHEIDEAEEALLRTMTVPEEEQPKRRKTDPLCDMFKLEDDPQKPQVDTKLQESMDYLRCIGRRVMIFADQLVKASKLMTDDLGFPRNYPKQCFAVFQQYLQHCEVAFVDFEYTDDLDEMVRVLAIGSKSKYQDNVLREKELLKARRKAEGMKKLEMSQDIWGTLADKTLTEDLALNADELDDFEDSTSGAKKKINVTRYTEVNSNLSHSCALAASHIYIEADALVAILYISAVNLGLQYVMLSDIVRWCREDRIRVPTTNMFAYTGKKTKRFATMESSADLPTVKPGRNRFDIPLFEYERTTLWIWQSLNLPSLTMRVDYQQLTARILYHLNLPSCLMERISALMQLAPPNDAMDSDSLKLQGDIDQGMSCRDLCSNPTTKDYHKFTLIRKVFGRSAHKAEYSDVFFSIETKIMAYVLLSLKLMFGLDDSTESTPNTDGAYHLFNVDDWILQLQMRLMLCEGYDPFDVLQSDRPVFELLPKFPLSDGHGTSFKSIGGEKITECVAFRGAGFINSIPHSSIGESAFNVPNPLIDFVSSRSFNRNCDNAIYVPLRHQPDIVQDFFDRNKLSNSEYYKDIDKSMLKILNRQYDDYDVHTERPSMDNAEFLSAVYSKERCATKKERDHWKELFPCANSYTRYPRPLWAQGNHSTAREDSEYMKRMNRRCAARGYDIKDSGVRCFYASNRCVQDAFLAAEKSMSKAFRQLLQNFSQLIGEDAALLYSAFIMLEYQILDRSEYHDLAQRFVDGVAVPMGLLVFDAKGEASNHTVQVTSDENITDKTELCWVRFGVPRNWGVSLWNVEDELDESDRKWIDSDSEVEEPAQSDDNDDTEDETMIAMEDAGKDSEKLVRHKARFSDKIAYDFDTVWQMVSMRYW